MATTCILFPYLSSICCVIPAVTHPVFGSKRESGINSQRLLLYMAYSPHSQGSLLILLSCNNARRRVFCAAAMALTSISAGVDNTVPGANLSRMILEVCVARMVEPLEDSPCILGDNASIPILGMAGAGDVPIPTVTPRGLKITQSAIELLDGELELFELLELGFTQTGLRAGVRGDCAAVQGTRAASPDALTGHAYPEGQSRQVIC